MTAATSSWKCVVCGYVHHGDTAPELCPVCGAPAEDFEAYQDASPPVSQKTRQWRCLICGHIHDGDVPPDACSVCGAGIDEFEPCAIAAPITSANTDHRKVVIVGGGIAAVSAAESVRQTLPQAEIVMIAGEKGLPYYRLNLTRRLAGELDDTQLAMHPESWYAEKKISLRSGVKVASLDPEKRSIEIENGETVTFDKAILACGAHPFIPPIPGADEQGVSAVRTLEDVHDLLGRVRKDMPCVCIGGGILGLETAGALASRGVQVTLLEGFEYLLPRQLNREAARVLEAHVKGLGITVFPKSVTKAIEGGLSVEAVLLEDGTRLPAAAVTITTGVRANSHLARRAGLAVNQGIVVDAFMATSHPDVYAAGDCAEYCGQVYGLWEPAQYQGAIAGFNAAGATTEFGGIPRMNTLKVLGIKLFSMGVIQPDDGSYIEIADEESGIYRRFLFRDGMLVGAILVGDASLAVAATRAAREHINCSALTASSTMADVEKVLANL